jgi:hypothetical protein
LRLNQWIVPTGFKENFANEINRGYHVPYVSKSRFLAQTQTPDLIPLESIRLTSPETLRKFVQVLQEVKQRFWK